MNPRHILQAGFACCAFALLAACGGGGGDPAPTTPTPPSDPVSAAAKTTLVSSYTSGLAALNTFAGLSSSSFLDLFDTGFLDAGYNKSQVSANLSAEAAVTAASPDFPSFPMAQLSGASITNCDAALVCTLTGTLTNTDADTTSVSFSTQVKLAADGKLRLLGDQKSS